MSGHLLQTEWWGRLKGEFGWDVRLCLDGVTRVFRRNVGPFRLAYLPYAYDEHGAGDAAAAIHSVRNNLCEIGHALNPCDHVVRWDVPWSVDRFDTATAGSFGFKRAPVRIQPPDTVILLLDGDEETLLGAMKPKTRYNIRLAAKRGVTVSCYAPHDSGCRDALTRWYGVYRETAQRDRIAIHPEQYYRRVVELSREPGSPRVRLFLAHHESDLLGGVIVGSWGGTSTYMYGAGADIKRNLMASYLLQWEAIREARSRGDRWYDFFGIPPADDPEHPMHGLYRFKTGFGGRILHRPGAWDLPLATSMATLYRGAEYVRGWYFHSFRKRASRSGRGGSK